MSSFVLTKTVTMVGHRERVLDRTLSSADGRAVPVAEADSGEAGDTLLEMLRVMVALDGGDPGAVEVAPDEDWGDCECCGSYVNETLRVLADGVEVVRFWHGGHLGGGDDLSEADPLFVRAAEAMGHSVEIRRSGTFVVELDRGTDRHDAQRDAERARANADLALELRLDGDRPPGYEYVESLLPALPPVSRATVCGLLEGRFAAMLDELSGGGGELAGRVVALREVLVVDGGAEQAGRLPAELLAAYVGGEWPDDAAQAAVAEACPLSTHIDLCRAALDRGVAVPESRLPFGLRPARG